MAKKARKKMSGIRKLMFLFLYLLIIVGSAALISGQTNRYNALRAINDGFQADLAREQAIHTDLLYQRAHFDSDAYIEQLARDRLGWVRPNEVMLRVVRE